MSIKAAFQLHFSVHGRLVTRGPLNVVLLQGRQTFCTIHSLRSIGQSANPGSPGSGWSHQIYDWEIARHQQYGTKLQFSINVDNAMYDKLITGQFTKMDSRAFFQCRHSLTGLPSTSHLRLQWPVCRDLHIPQSILYQLILKTTVYP